MIHLHRQRRFFLVGLTAVCLMGRDCVVNAFTSQARECLTCLSHRGLVRPMTSQPLVDSTIHSSVLIPLLNKFSGARSTRNSIGSSQLRAIPEIEKWRILEGGSVQGFVKNHPTIRDGDIITTSPLKAPNAVGAKMVVVTSSGTKYKLMEPLKKESKIGTVTVNKRFAASRKTPSVNLSGNLPLLDDWKLLDNNSVQGVVFNHPTIPDGQILVTSTLKNLRALSPKSVVNTSSGSRYQLGKPEFEESPDPKEIGAGNKSTGFMGSVGFSFFGSPRTSIPAPVTARAAKTVAEVENSTEELRRRRVLAQRDFGLTGETLGENGEYLLAGQPAKSTSGKSLIFRAYKADENGLPIGDVDRDAITVKISSNNEQISREAANYRSVAQSGVTRGQFVQLIEYLPADKMNSNSGRSKNQCALVMERGEEDLKTYLARRRDEGGLSGKELRDAAAAAAQCIQAVHSSGLVWTDLKTENFVVTRNGEFKGIDLESAMPINGNPVDYSPEACPPEFARAFLAGEGPYFILQPSYDIWSFGMMCFEMATGAGYFDNKSPIQITRALSTMESFEFDSNVELDGRMKSLIQLCLQVDPRKRPSTAQVLLHPYFLTTGIGPFSF